MIVKETGCKIVISSTWRLGKSLEEMKEWFSISPVLKEAVIGKTPTGGKIRGDEIIKHLETFAPVGAKYAILDDDSDFYLSQSNSLFLTNSHTGLTHDIAREVIDYLGGK